MALSFTVTRRPDVNGAVHVRIYDEDGYYADATASNQIIAVEEALKLLQKRKAEHSKPKV